MAHLKIRRSRAVAALAAVAGAAALITPAGASAAAAPACQTDQLVGFIAGSSGTAGSVVYTLRLDNLGPACTLHGFPGVSAVNVKGKQLGKPAVRSGAAGRTVTMRAATDFAWSSATVQLQITEAGNFPTARCAPALAAGLRVFPPNQTTALAVPLPFTACTVASQTFMSVQSVR